MPPYTLCLSKLITYSRTQDLALIGLVMAAHDRVLALLPLDLHQEPGTLPLGVHYDKDTSDNLVVDTNPTQQQRLTHVHSTCPLSSTPFPEAGVLHRVLETNPGFLHDGTNKSPLSRFRLSFFRVTSKVAWCDRHVCSTTLDAENENNHQALPFF